MNMGIMNEKAVAHCSGDKIRRAMIGAFLLGLFTIPAAAQQIGIGWPRTIQSDGELIQVYQPQVDKWEGGKLEAREAVVITRKNLGQAIYGVVSLSARTTLDQERRLVTLYDIEVKNASFPDAIGEESSYVESATRSLSQWSFTLALDRLLADLAITQTEEKNKGNSFGANPPHIYIRQNPAVLILIDGQPVLKKVNDTSLMRVINSPAVIVFEPSSGSYFLQGEGYWMTAPNLNGVWIKANSPPKSLAAVLQQEEEQTSAKTITSPSEAPPEVIVSTEPAELIQLKGEAQFSPIDGTKLLYVTNTDGDLFLSVPDQRYYVLLSGRWFRAQKLDGPWEFVAGSELPADFASIPPGHPKGTVLASVPGTLQARDAVVAAQVPQTATVDRKRATFSATYDGEPQFKPIEGTDMSYAVNSPDDIIRVGGKYYAVSNGVWFAADIPLGPWVVCDSVATEIYSIPPTSPVYHMRYVYVYDSTPDFVYVGYTPGYFGAFIWDGVVVYGTGYWYPCWAVDYWYGWPWTWGFGWHYAYWGWGFHWRPWYRHPWYWHSWRNPGWGYGSWNRRVLYNRSVERIRSRVNLQSGTVYDRWKAPTVINRRPVPLQPPSGINSRPRMVPGRPIPGRPDLYAGHDGNVYQHRTDGWYRRDGQRWESLGAEPTQPPTRRPVAPIRPLPPQQGPKPRANPPQPAPPRPHDSAEQLERQRQARIQGENRVNQYRTMRPPAPARPSPPSRPSGGGRPPRRESSH